MQIESIEYAGGAAHLVSTPLVNWVILHDDTGTTLIDSGYPGQVALLEQSLLEVGTSLAEVRAVLLTHAHVDHIGGVARLRDRLPVPVYAAPWEDRHARREFLQQADPVKIAAIVWRPRNAAWLASALRVGALSRTGVSDAQAFSTEVLAALPGAPTAVLSPGHSDGHAAYLLAGGQVLVSGDALVTAHPTTTVDGPQLLGKTFTHDFDQAQRSLHTLGATAATVIFPGHGPVWRGPVAEAATEALRRVPPRG